jgi:RNA polymerase sigma factor (sigma-70 family)
LRSFPPSDPSGDPGSVAVADAVGHLFRREAGRLVAILAHRFGPENLHLAEDTVQDALVKAMQTWPFTGIPANPSAWILQVACNRAIDQTRRTRWLEGNQPGLGALAEECLQSVGRPADARFEDEIHDSQLCMMFVCCHPSLPAETQVALTLKILCGFGDREIAAAFLISEAAAAKRLARGRKALQEHRVTTDLPASGDLAPRLQSVLQALYLLFNEGYKASHGILLRVDLCTEAIRLAELLLAPPFKRRPEVDALLALMYFNASRLDARISPAGDMLLLPHQDRNRWDNEKIRRGLDHLEKSGQGAVASRFHLEAGIAACHSLSPDEAGTDWRQILSLYDQLLALEASPIVAMNRAVALAKVEGPQAGLEALAEIPDRMALERHHLFHAVTGNFHLEAGNSREAALHFRKAWELATVTVERDLLARKINLAEGGNESLFVGTN